MKGPVSTIGAAWRPELALAIERRRDLAAIELLAENYHPRRLPPSVLELRDRGIAVLVHGVGLSLAGGERPDARRIERLADMARAVKAPFVSEHLAFVRAGAQDAGHLLPPPRTREMLDIVVDNLAIAQRGLPVPLALENIARLFEWPSDEMTEADFLAEILERSGCHLLLDVANLYANSRNFGFDPIDFLERMPRGRVAYAHVAGGSTCHGFVHDTHRHPVGAPVLQLLGEAVARLRVPTVVFEWDSDFPTDRSWNRQLDGIQSTLRGSTVGVAS